MMKLTGGDSFSLEIYTDAPERRRECLYFLALGHYKIASYSEARTYNQQLLKLEPRNAQALGLAKQIDEKVSTGKIATNGRVTGCH